MKNIVDEEARVDIATRLARLDVESVPSWGSLDAPGMLSHLLRAFEITFAEVEVDYKPSFFSSAIGKWLVLKSPIPWGKGLSAPAVFLEREPGSDFEAEKTLAQAYLARFAAPDSATWGRSPIFGPLSAKEWGLLHYRHCDHHLRQFGI